MPSTWTGSWSGGRCYQADGRTVFVLERMRRGRRYTIPLDAGNEREALAELALFERDPEGFLTRRQAAEKAAAEAVILESERVEAFLAWQQGRKRTERHRRNLRTFLSDWSRELGRRDLRKISGQGLKTP